MREFTASESTLVARLGVYGVWLVKHGRKIPKMRACVVALMDAYMGYRNASDPVNSLDYAPREKSKRTMALFRAVDRVVDELLWECVWDSYPAACSDYCNGSDAEPEPVEL